MQKISQIDQSVRMLWFVEFERRRKRTLPKSELIQLIFLHKVQIYSLISNSAWFQRFNDFHVEIRSIHVEMLREWLSWQKYSFFNVFYFWLIF
jgi:hypothetical protein